MPLTTSVCNFMLLAESAQSLHHTAGLYVCRGLSISYDGEAHDQNMLSINKFNNNVFYFLSDEMRGYRK